MEKLQTIYPPSKLNNLLLMNLIKLCWAMWITTTYELLQHVYELGDGHSPRRVLGRADTLQI